jgi:hypothetical protein
VEDLVPPVHPLFLCAIHDSTLLPGTLVPAVSHGRWRVPVVGDMLHPSGQFVRRQA